MLNFTYVMETLLIDHMLLATAAGYGIQPGNVAKPAEIKRAFLNKTWTSDKMTLSKRLHGSSIRMKTDIVDAVSASMKRADTFVETARELYTGYGKGGVINQADLPDYLSKLSQEAKKLAGGDVSSRKEFEKALERAKQSVDKLSENGAPTKALKAAYSELVKAAETLKTSAIEKAVNTAVQERTRYYSERIARTEIARAFAEGVILKTMDDPDVVGYSWKLGSRHPKFDICDFHAKADLYGMGAGIYPKGSFPEMPAHPHCHCYPREVTIGSAESDDGKFNKSAGDEYLKGLDPAELKQLMTKAGANEFMNGGDWRKLLNHYSGAMKVEPRITSDMMEE
jgi:hypothetical protein